jgi:hypothetical protein
LGVKIAGGNLGAAVCTSTHENTHFFQRIHFQSGPDPGTPIRGFPK